MKKLLILNGSHSEIPLIQAGKKLGYYVITSGNKPELIGHKYSDEYVDCDFSDTELVLNTFKDKGLAAVCSCANDFGALTAAYLSEALGLPGHDTYENALTIHHKNRFKAFAEANNVPTPRARAYDSVDAALRDAAALKYPVMVKPVDLTGGKGVTKVTDESGFAGAVKKAFDMSRKKVIVTEEFAEGTQHSFSTFLINKKVAAFFSDNEYSDYNRFLVSTSGGPADDVDKTQDILIAEAEKIASVLGLCDGVFHYQYILSADKKPHILEITRRCSGDMYPVPVEHALGLPWAEWIVRAECGLDMSGFAVNNFSQSGFGGRHCVMAENEGVVKNVFIADELKGNIYDKFFWGGAGSVIADRFTDKIGILFFEFATREEMLDKCGRIKSLVKIEFE